MGILDERGRIKGTRWNFLDFLIILGLFVVMPVFFIGYRIFTTHAPTPILVPTTYFTERGCPNCGMSHTIHIKKGELIPKFYEMSELCPRCGNKGILIDNLPKPEPEPELEKPIYYAISRVCPNCSHNFSTTVPLGELAPKGFEGICPFCENEIKIEEGFKVESVIDPQKEYYRRALRKGLP